MCQYYLHFTGDETKAHRVWGKQPTFSLEREFSLSDLNWALLIGVNCSCQLSICLLSSFQIPCPLCLQWTLKTKEEFWHLLDTLALHILTSLPPPPPCSPYHYVAPSFQPTVTVSGFMSSAFTLPCGHALSVPYILLTLPTVSERFSHPHLFNSQLGTYLVYLPS